MRVGSIAQRMTLDELVLGDRGKWKDDFCMQDSERTYKCKLITVKRTPTQCSSSMFVWLTLVELDPGDHGEKKDDLSCKVEMHVEQMLISTYHKM